MAQIDGAGQQDTDNEDAEALQAALAQRQVTLQGQPQGGSDVPSHKNSDPVIRRIGNSTLLSASYRKTSCTVIRSTGKKLINLYVVSAAPHLQSRHAAPL